MTLAPVAAFKRRKAGDVVTVALTGGDEPPVKIKFVIPDPVQEAEIEAKARAQHQAILKSPGIMTALGLGDHSITQEQAEGLRDLIYLTIAADTLWRDWNVSFEEDRSVSPRNQQNIAQLLGDRFIRLAWNAHLSASLALDRAEGNGSAVSQNGSSAAAANTAGGAQSGTPPAPEASPAEPVSGAGA